MPRFMKYLAACCCLALAGGALAASSSGPSYAMLIKVSKPKGSAGEKPESSQPASTDFTPCNNKGKLDAVTFELSYNAGADETDLLDVYMMFFNPNASGYSAPRYYVVSRRELLQGGLAITPRWTVDDIDPFRDIYLDATTNLGGSIKENLIGSSLVVDGLSLGTWQVVGIVADRTKVDFEDSDTWDAWDVATVVLGMPWSGSGYYNSSCQ